MKTKRPFALAAFLLVAAAACASPSPTENGIRPDGARRDGGGFGSGTRIDSTTAVGGGFGSGT